MKPEIAPISCRETTYLVSESRDAALDDEQNARLAAHLDTCDACRIASTQFAQLFAQLDTLLARQRR